MAADVRHILALVVIYGGGKNASDFDKQGKMGLLVKRRGQEANSQNLLCPPWESVTRDEIATFKYFALHC